MLVPHAPKVLEETTGCAGNLAGENEMPVLSDYLGLTRVINLPERTDRLREVTQQLQTLCMPFQPGKVELYRATRPTELAGFNSLGEHGCFRSHLEILRDACDRGVRSVLVMEDDCEVLPRNLERIAEVAAALEARSWGFAYLGHIVPNLTETPAGLIPYEGPLQTTHLYAVHASVLGAVVEYLEGCLRRPPGDPVGGPMPVDGAFTMFRAAHPEVITLIAQPSLARQRSSRSSITYRSFEVIPGIQQAMSLARLLKRRLSVER
jgi:hypothetical protein